MRPSEQIISGSKLPRAHSMRQYIVAWAGGLFLALVGLWLLSFWLVNSVPCFTRADGAPFFFHAEGKTVRHRTEGFADTHVGRHGIAGIQDITTCSGERVVIWGDSYVEAFNVADSDKMAQVLTRISPSYGLRELTGLALGKSGNSFADYYFQAPYYEEQLGPIALHVIVIGQPEDLLPDCASAHGARFISTGGFQLLPEPSDRYSWIALRPWLARWRLGAAWLLLREASTMHVRFGVGPERTTSIGSASSLNGAAATEPEVAPATVAAIRYMLGALQSRMSAPIVIVSLADVPFVSRHRVVLAEPEPPLNRVVARVAAEFGIGYVDMAPDFGALWERSHRFPHGFQNSHPWLGHLNRDGHRLVAEAICRYMKENHVAVHAD